MRDFNSLSQKEILALAISLEEEDERIYSDFGVSLKENFPGTAQVFEEMRQEESGHRRALIDLYKQKFGEHIPLIRRQDVRGFVQRKSIWLNTPLRLEQIRGQVSTMEAETRRFYQQAAVRAQDASIRQLLDDLAEAETTHVERAAQLEKTELKPEVREEEDKAKRRLFVLQIVQPGLAGLMDGSVSTLAPVFAAAFATWLRVSEAAAKSPGPRETEPSVRQVLAARSAEQTAGVGFVFFLADFGLELGLLQLGCALNVAGLGFGKVVEQLANAGVLGADGSLLVKQQSQPAVVLTCPRICSSRSGVFSQMDLRWTNPRVFCTR